MRRYWWTLQSFGLTPSKLWYRVADRESPRVFCNSIPKSGTNLIQRALFLSPSLYRKILPTVNGQNVDRWGERKLVNSLRAGQVLVAHLPHSQKLNTLLDDEDIPKLLMVRDPRDIILSHCEHVVKNENHRLHEIYSSLPDVESRLELTIRGDQERGIDPIRVRFEYFFGWLKTSTLIVRFEDLVGPRGGGDREAQVSALTTMYDHIGFEISDRDLKSIAGNLFYTASPTFRKGLIGQWRDEMSSDIKKLVDEKMREVISRYGYDNSATE